MRVAITGGIGSGKSFVSEIFSQFGYDVYDCDSAAKKIMRTSAFVRDEIIKAFGEETYLGNMPVKKVLSHLLLSSEDNEHKLNSIVHPAVAADFSSSSYKIMECAILFSSGFDKLVDKVICVSAPYDVRLRRIMCRDNLNKAKAEEWINCQMPQEMIEEKSDFIIYNDGVENVFLQVKTWLDSYGCALK